MTPISPELSLAMNVVANPGVYALLLGSGVSRDAGIPTGWEVVLDLVRKVAAAEGSDAEPDPESWYRAKYRKPPQYSTLLEELAPTADERRSLLEPYFEPTSEEREEGIKTPTDAHRAIARMAAEGWIRVIVTTNFDRLLEVALEEAGVTPAVIATADQATGATPLAHSKCTVVKVHGDYLDPRIKNSEEELATYDQSTNTLLDQVFDEYGLVVCGWSGEYDAALRDAIDRCRSRRYTTYWCTLDDLKPPAKQVADNRAAQPVTISDADSLFVELEERITSIDKAGQRHPMDTRAAVEALKRYLVEDRHRIRLRELVQEATEELVSHLNEEEFPVSATRTDEEIAERVQRLNALSERSIALVANGCFWGSSEHDDAWVGVIRRLMEFEARNPAANKWGYIFRYPALLALYSAGVGSVAAGRYESLASQLLVPIRSPNERERRPMVQSMYPYEILPDDAAQILLADGQTSARAKGRYLHSTLKPVFSALTPGEDDYTEAFDRFEYLACLVEMDIASQGSDADYYGYRWFGRRALPHRFWSPPILETIQREVERDGTEWPPLQAGLFGGSSERLVEAIRLINEATEKSRW